MSFIVKSARPSAAAVREWGRNVNLANVETEGFEPLPGTAANQRGRLNPALIAAYNKSHRGQNAYAEGEAVKSVTVTAKPEKGRSKTVKVNIAEARAAAVAQGIEVGARGRLPKAVLNSLILG